MLRPALTFSQIFILLLAVVSSLAAKPSDPYRIAPGPFDGRKTEHPGKPGPMNYSVKGLTIAVRYLEPPDRAEFVRAADANLKDPFSTVPGRPENYHSFLLTFENDSPGTVVFQPGHAFVVTDKNERTFPIDLTDLYILAARGGANDPEVVINRVAPLLFETSIEIPQGRSISRLLVFGRFPEKKWKEFRLILGYVEIDSEPRTLTFGFHRHMIKK